MNEVWFGDCLELIPRIPDNFINLTVTSPPYDNLRNYKNSLNWNSAIWKGIVKELFRVTRRGGGGYLGGK